MFGWLKKLQLGSRWIAVTGGAGGLGYLAVRLTERQAFFVSFIEAGAIAFVAMVVLSTGQNFWRGDRLEEAQAPGGWMVRFRPARRVVGLLEQRLDSQMTAVNQRLYDLESAVFKEPEMGSDEEE
jgi:hypothetical protein